jgi:hypothetical protein
MVVGAAALAAALLAIGAAAWLRQTSDEGRFGVRIGAGKAETLRALRSRVRDGEPRLFVLREGPSALIEGVGPLAEVPFADVEEWDVWSLAWVDGAVNELTLRFAGGRLESAQLETRALEP